MRDWWQFQTKGSAAWKYKINDRTFIRNALSKDKVTHQIHLLVQPPTISQLKKVTSFLCWSWNSVSSTDNFSLFTCAYIICRQYSSIFVQHSLL
jgi:hypothetical protein